MYLSLKFWSYAILMHKCTGAYAKSTLVHTISNLSWLYEWNPKTSLNNVFSSKLTNIILIEIEKGIEFSCYFHHFHTEKIIFVYKTLQSDP